MEQQISPGEFLEITTPSVTAVEKSELQWFGRPEAIEDMELDLDALISEREGTAEFAAAQKEVMQSLSETLLKNSYTLDALRIKAGFTQAQLAKMTSLTQPYIARLESGEVRNPGMHLLRQLSTALNVSLDQIFQAFEQQQQ